MSNQILQEKLNRHLSYLDQDENNLHLLVHISNLYLEMENLELAQVYLNKASAIDRIACLGQQGLLHLNQGQFAQAKEHFIEALQYADTPALRYNLGFTHFITYDFEQAWEVLEPLKENEYYPEAQLLIARILQKQNSYEEAVSIVEHSLNHNPNNVEALGLLSLLYFDQNKEEQAKETSLRALQISPHNYDAKLVNILIRVMTQETHIEEIEELLQINPQDSRLWFALGNTYLAQGDIESAKHALNKAIEIYPEFYDCLIVLAWCQLLNNNIGEAYESYQKASHLAEELSDAWGGLALIHALSEDFIPAEQLIDKAKQLNSECFLTEIAESIYFNHKNPMKAKQHLFRALKNTEMAISEKLVLFINEIENCQLH
ncbi:hypothetical protein EP47_09275 [Legionella norrlandica]|uniref:Tetratricopeptide repeat protein n=1 Tax=Legionella norrlandica TaxID=1498499 RepID=A0A0A2T7B0_9GAMM|nr:tetratricopeptide repeat protein [Legionella norrlandica]KGP63313.1 hypothetical protein EP47_09275 [Legionella norrlandica]